MAQINLLAQSSYYIAAARRRRRILFGMAAGVAAVVAVVWLGLWVWQRMAQQQLDETTVTLQDIEAKIRVQETDARRVRLFEGRLAALEQLFQGRQSWVPLWQEFERLLPPTVVLTSLTVRDGSGAIEVVGQAPTPDDVALLIASLTSTTTRPTLFSAVSVDQVTREVEKSADGIETGAFYRFTARLTRGAQ